MVIVKQVSEEFALFQKQSNLIKHFFLISFTRVFCSVLIYHYKTPLKYYKTTRADN